MVGYFIFRNKNNSSIKISPYLIPTPQKTSVETQHPPTEIPIATPTPIESKLTTTVSDNGIIRGQIVCDYIVPAAPDFHGTANIKSNWNNTKVSVCVSINGGGTLIANDESINGSRVDIANWISLNTSYQFNLYSGLNCDGIILSSCQINQSAPTKAPFSH